MLSTALRKFRNNILVGLLLIAPIYFTIFIVQLLFTWFTGLLLDFFPEPIWKTKYEILFRIAALVAVLVLLFFIGLLVRNMLGKRIYQLGDRLLARIPIVSRIYVWIRQIIETLLAQRKTLFQEVVLIEYPRAGVRSIGFVTGIVPDHLTRIFAPGDGGPYLSIFIPTTPNPTSGWLCILPRSQTVPLPMSPAEAMKLIVSGGAVYPSDRGPVAQTSLLEKLDQWMAEEQSPAKPS